MIEDLSEAADDDFLDQSASKPLNGLPMSNISFSKKTIASEYITVEVEDTGYGLERETRKNILAGLEDNVSPAMYSLPSLAISQLICKALGKGIKF